MLSTQQEIEKEEYEFLLAKERVNKLTKDTKAKEKKQNFLKAILNRQTFSAAITSENDLIPFEIKEDLLFLQKNKFSLKSLIRPIEVKNLQGTIYVADTRDEYLYLFDSEAVANLDREYKNYEDECEKYILDKEKIELENRHRSMRKEELLPLPKAPINPKEKLYNNFFVCKWNLQTYQKIFRFSKLWIDDFPKVYNHFIERIADILVSTENKIIYKAISEEQKTKLIINLSETGIEVRRKIKEFFETLKSSSDKNVYISQNFYDEIQHISKTMNISLITDLPVNKNMKLLCGTPIKIIPNEIWQPIKGKEILVYGNLYNSFNFYYDEKVSILSSEVTSEAFSRYFQNLRISTNYQCKKEFNDIIIAEIEIQN